MKMDVNGMEPAELRSTVQSLTHEWVCRVVDDKEVGGYEIHNPDGSDGEWIFAVNPMEIER